jgi:hypothetical protein
MITRGLTRRTFLGTECFSGVSTIFYFCLSFYFLKFYRISDEHYLSLANLPNFSYLLPILQVVKFKI